MELLICGSSAAEPIPALFCHCEICKDAWETGSKNRRSRTGYQIGDAVRIDFGPDYLLHRERHQLHFERLKHLFVTHRHKDHFAPLPLFFHTENSPEVMTLHASKETLEEVPSDVTETSRQRKIIIDEFNHDSQPRILEDGMLVVPVMANHCAGTLNLIFRTYGGFTLLIGTDSGVFFEDTWKKISEFQFDLVILDATAGKAEFENYPHMNFRENIETVRRFRADGIAKKECRFLVSHFSHNPNVGMTHKEMEEWFLPYGIEPAWDGMTVPLDHG